MDTDEADDKGGDGYYSNSTKRPCSFITYTLLRTLLCICYTASIKVSIKGSIYESILIL